MLDESGFTKLHQALLEHYDMEELRTLCAELGVDFDDLRGEGRKAKARELVLWLQRRGRLEELEVVTQTPSVTSGPVKAATSVEAATGSTLLSRKTRAQEEAASSLKESPTYHTCFISYSSKDDVFVRKLHADLQHHGVDCWFAPEDMKIGDRIRPTIDESIEIYDKLLLVLSRHSIASQWVEQEVEAALARERKLNKTVLVPIRVNDIVMEMEGGWPALIKNTRNIGNFSGWKNRDLYQKALERLLRDLKAED